MVAFVCHWQIQVCISRGEIQLCDLAAALVERLIFISLSAKQMGVLFGAFFFLLSCLGLGVAPATKAQPLLVEAIATALDPEDHERRSFGRLTFLAGFQLRSSHPHFGGLSGLAVSADGGMLYAVTDRGHWVWARMHHAPDGRLSSLDGWQITPLLTPGEGAVQGNLADAEGLARDRDGTFIVSFEREHRLWRYPPPSVGFHSPPQPVPIPPDLARAPPNGGAEAVTVLPDGQLLILTEEYENPDGSIKAWLIAADRFVPLSYSSTHGFRPTDAAGLRNGDVLVLERRYSLVSGWSGRIQRLSRASLDAGGTIVGQEIARFEPPLLVDNFEGIAVREDPQVGTLVYVVTDDNFNRMQRTLLLQFRLEPGSGS